MSMIILASAEFRGLDGFPCRVKMGEVEQYKQS